MIHQFRDGSCILCGMSFANLDRIGWECSTRPRKISEQAAYDQVAEELTRSYLKDGLWTRAFANAAGDLQKTRAIYIQLRAGQILEETRDSEHFEQQAGAPPLARHDNDRVRPWVRFWARIIDCLLFSACLRLMLGIITPGSITLYPPVCYGLFFIFLWCFY